MNNQADLRRRAWWPFPLIPLNAQTEQHKAEIRFHETAANIGFRSYVENSDIGVVTDDGRECIVVYRGRCRRELLLVDQGKCVSRRLFEALSDEAAFAEATAAALEWLQSTRL